MYQHLEPLVRHCTLRQNARAGVQWLSVIVGEKVKKSSASEQLEQLSRALSDVKEISDGELADAGWLVAELLRTHLGGDYAWDADQGQVALVARPSGRKHFPMALIEAQRRGEDPLARFSKLLSGKRARAEEVNCRGVAVAEVLRSRLAHP